MYADILQQERMAVNEKREKLKTHGFFSRIYDNLIQHHSVVVPDKYPTIPS